ncbi:MAG: DUF308 domain-containing protein [Bacteroidales bacterium]|jgi:uncharacterized membrane protein HdeD (DUF308 family)|nr:DUF308 domain-containing protein [Bacteroidales bacterium]
MENKKSNSGWLAFLVSGIVAIGYGVLAIMFSDTFVEILQKIMRISGICIAATGGVFLVAAIMRMSKKLPWGLLLLEAVALIVVGVLSAIYSNQALALLVILIGIWSAMIGAFMLLVMARTKNLWNKGFYIVSAILSIIFGVLTIAHPFGFVKWFIILSGIIALVFGLIMMMFAFAVHRADREAEKEKVEEVKVEVIEEPKAEE